MARSKKENIAPPKKNKIVVETTRAAGGSRPRKIKQIPIVGIGASAGGLEALELFLANVPENCGMAFVIIQHLDPTHKGVMVELLQHSTTMQVSQAADRTRVKENCVYVIPPNKDMSILHGVLHLLDPVAPRGLRLPIDFFLRSLADDRQEHSIGVILSGMGSDGTLGLRAIKEKAGAVFVQDPASAKFDGMPHSAIEAGLADVIAPANALPEKIIAYLHYAPLIVKEGPPVDEKSDSALEKVVILLRVQTGHDFSHYKKTTIYRRVERRMGLHQIDKIASYVHFLRENPQEVELLFRELLIGVTNFFRDPEEWENIRKEVIPALLEGRTSNQTLRAWVPACSTGEEAYSLAILFKEVLAKTRPAVNITLQIFATDLDQHAIQKAREGVFPANIAADVPPNLLDRYFIKEERGYRAAKSIREMIIFAPQNLISDPPFTKLDLVSCRNLLIYLTTDLQKKLLPVFHYSLNPGGFLFLGSAETVGNFANLFSPLSGKTRIHRRLDSPLTPEAFEFPTTLFAPKPLEAARPATPVTNLQALADELILRHFSPAAVLTNDKGDILYISGSTGKYLEPAAGKANWNIFVMAREGLRHGLSTAFQQAVRTKVTVTLKNMRLVTSAGRQAVQITIQSLHGTSPLNGMVVIVFTDTETGPQARRSGPLSKDSALVKELELELERTRQEVQSIREEMQSSQEELKSTNEEMQSANEELQSTNEELTTSKEELQSMNEELHTVNHELEFRLDELSHINNDMKNLLDSTDIATLFVDNNLCVRRFTNETGKITRLIPGDVGRPITDIASALLYPELADDAREVLRTLAKVEKQISSTQTGSWYKVRILPYRTFENLIDGVVITFTDITEYKKLESEFRLTEERYREQLDRKEQERNSP